MGVNGAIKALHEEAARDLASEFEELYRESYSTVYNSVYFNMLDRDAAEDVTAEGGEFEGIEWYVLLNG